MDFSYITNSGYCKVTGQTPDGNAASPPPCDNVLDKTPVEVTISDSSGFVEVGQTWPFQATLTYSDGTIADVTSLATWASYNTSIATIAASGIATGIGVGLATITATYAGFTVESELEVAALCVDAPIDVVLVLDRSGSMAQPDAEGDTRIQRVREAAKIFVDNTKTSEDKIGIVSFAGIYKLGATINAEVYTEGDATLDLGMTSSKAQVKTALDSYAIREPCLFSDNTGTRCATGIGNGLEVAREEINGNRHETGHKKVIVLFTDGQENINKPTPASISDTIKGEGTLIYGIGLDVPSYNATLQNISSPNLYFPSPSTYELAQLFAQIPNVICYGYYGYPVYY